MSQKTIRGVVVSDKADKTRVVLVKVLKKDPKYKKYYSFSKKYLAHDAKNQFKIGDSVVIESSKPISKKKRWVVKNPSHSSEETKSKKPKAKK